MKIFDLHIDLSSFCLTAGRNNINTRNELGSFFLPDQVDIPRLKEGEVKYFLANVCPIIATENSFKMPKNSMEETLRQINFYKNLKGINIVKNLDIETNNISALISIEGAYFIKGQKDLSLLTKMKEYGVVSIAPTWNIDNKLGTGAGNEKPEIGLTSLGHEFIEECERLGIIIDAVHASRKTFQDIAKISKKPFFVSHTASYQVNKHRRNLTDDEIRIIVKNGGIIGLSFIKDFIGKNSVEMVSTHLKHLINVGGADHISIGGDFDGMSQSDLIDNIEDVSKMQMLFDVFEKSGITLATLTKVASKNAKRFFKEML